jgi:hypothetical protein
MITAACEELHAAGIKPPEAVVADAGYWNGAHIEHLVNQGIQTLVCPEALKRATPRPGRDRGLYAFMRRFLESEAGHVLYKQRQAMIEPVFAHIKHNRRADRFQRRGRAACRSEWRLITATHNLLKLHRPLSDSLRLAQNGTTNGTAGGHRPLVGETHAARRRAVKHSFASEPLGPSGVRETASTPGPPHVAVLGVHVRGDTVDLDHGVGGDAGALGGGEIMAGEGAS